MKDQNIQVVKDYVEQVFNQKRLERFFDYIAEECILHSVPYVGLGLSPDDTSGRTASCGVSGPTSDPSIMVRAGSNSR